MADTQIVYRITDCCSLDGNFVDVEIDLLGNPYPGDGIYSRPLISGDLVINSSFTLEAGKSYLIIQGALSTAPLPPISIVDVNLEQGGVLSCRDANANTIPCAFLYYISPCCEEYGLQGPAAAQANLDNLGFDVDINGTFIYNGPTQGPTPLFPTQLINGACYTITRNQTDTLLTEVIDFALFSAVEGCEDLSCGDCPTLPGIHYLKFEPCCGGDPIYTRAEIFGGVISTDPDGQVEGSSQRSSYAVSGGTSANPSTPDFSVSDYLGVHQYLAAATATSALAGFVPGQCYTITLGSVGDGEISITEYLDLPYAPYQNQISEEIIDCETAPCPECNPTIYALTNCEGITINTETDLSAVLDTHVELEGIDGCWYVQEYQPFVITDGVDGTIDSSVSSRRVATSNRLPSISTQPVTVVGPCPEECPCLCYEVIGYNGAYTYIDCEGNSVYIMSSGSDKFCAQARPHLIGVEGEDFTLVTGSPCVDGECVPECYILTNCEPLEYPDQDAVLNSNLQSLSQYANTNSVVVLAGYEGCWTVTTATCQCITVTINEEVIETTLGSNLNGRPTFSFEYNGTTYYIWYNGPDWFITATLGSIITEELMAAAEGTDLCPTGLGWAASATNFPEIESLTTELCPEQCDCPVDVTVIQDYEDCGDCVGITAYKLINCQKENEVIYSIQDLSAYVGQVLKDDCACWIVQEIDYQPPSLTVIENPHLYSECETCLATYYQLDNCDESGTPLQIITASNLSSYIDQTIKIEGCTSCFTVSEYTEETEPENSQDVTVVESFLNCPDCLEVTSRCSTVFNNSTEDRTFTYIDVNGYPQETEIVKSGHFSLRHCVQYWDEPDTFIYNYYGDCNLLDTEIVPPADCSCFEVTIIPIDPETEELTTAIVTNATWNGSLFNGFKVYEFTVQSVLYYMWSNGLSWYMTQSVGSFAVVLATLKGVTDCPENSGWNTDNTLLPDGRDIDSVDTVEIPCEPFPGKLGMCPQYFPNKRKVKPGYNTPICSADKYDKITCNFADIAYKKVLELRYGISNCCPEEDEKWLIKKELIELQALTDPNYTCDPLTDCCGKQTSQCSCNS